MAYRRVVDGLQELNLGAVEKDSIAKQVASAAKAGHPVGQFLAAEAAEKAGKLADAFALYSQAVDSSHEEAAKHRDALKAKLSPAQQRDADAQIAAATKAGQPLGQFPAAETAEKAGKLADAFALYSQTADSSYEEAAKRRDALKAKLSPAQQKSSPGIHHKPFVFVEVMLRHRLEPRGRHPCLGLILGDL